MAHTGITRAAAVSNTRATSNTRERDTSTRRTFSRSSLRAAAAIVTSLPGSALAATLAGLALGATLAQAAQPASAQGSNATQEFVTAHRREILDEFMHLLAIPNIASDRANMRRNADAIMDMMQRRGLAPKMLTSSREPDVPPIVYGEWKVRNGKRTIVLYAHYDGQPVNPVDWATAPFTPTLRSAPLEKGGTVIAADGATATDPETRLYARGSGDDKLGVMVILSAIDALRATHRAPTDNIKIVFEGEEEAGSPHLADLLTEHKALLDSQLWVVCDGPVHPTGRKLVVYGARGDMNVDLTVYGPVRALHSGHYGNWAQNPALNLARLLASMKDEKGQILVPGWYDDVAPLGELEQRAIKEAAAYDEAIKRELGIAATESDRSLPAATTVPSLNINGMRSANVAAQASNIIPDSATAVLDLRLVLGNEPQRQYDKLLNFVRSKGYYVIDRVPTMQERLEHPLIANMKSRPGVYAAARTPMDNPLAHAMAAAIRASSDQSVIELPSSGGSLPLSIIQTALGTASIDVPTANYDDNQHAANENLRLGNLWEGINTYAALLTHR
jgi:acetylornithine deacetylase/succinyl-diaminopimelate desuccinylase-like protein